MALSSSVTGRAPLSEGARAGGPAPADLASHGRGTVSTHVRVTEGRRPGSGRGRGAVGRPAREQRCAGTGLGGDWRGEGRPRSACSHESCSVPALPLASKRRLAQLPVGPGAATSPPRPRRWALTWLPPLPPRPGFRHRETSEEGARPSGPGEAAARTRGGRYGDLQGPRAPSLHTRGGLPHGEEGPESEG